ncbi:MAG: hypothetical protein IJV27_06540 [Prevotella sp.]|nr:hypothetical protein [Prevotella sp.]
MNYCSPETEVILINPEEIMQVNVGSDKVSPGDAEGKQNDIDFGEEVGGDVRPNVWDD